MKSISINFNRSLDQAKNLLEVFKDVFYVAVRFQDYRSLKRFFDKGSKLLCKSCYVFPYEIHSCSPLIKGAINNTIVMYRHCISRLDDIHNYA